MTTITPALSTSGAATATAPAPTVATEDRFLKLLVAQMQNQDPLNPMDNAQVTSQMAQINTVAGIDKLNRTVEGLTGQFVQLQALQGAGLVGRDVIVAGDALTANDEGLPQGGYEIAAPADNVTVEILNGAGIVLDTIETGAQSAGRHGFEWIPKPGVDPASAERFRVVASAGAAKLAATPLMRDRVDAVALAGDTLTLELRRLGSQPYAAIKAFN